MPDRRKRRHINICKKMKELGYCGVHAASQSDGWICMCAPHPGSMHHRHFNVNMKRFKLKRNGVLLFDGKVLAPFKREVRPPTREELYRKGIKMRDQRA